LGRQAQALQVARAAFQRKIIIAASSMAGRQQLFAAVN
jgi:hypothetical protein